MAQEDVHLKPENNPFSIFHDVRRKTKTKTTKKKKKKAVSSTDPGARSSSSIFDSGAGAGSIFDDVQSPIIRQSLASKASVAGSKPVATPSTKVRAAVRQPPAATGSGVRMVGVIQAVPVDLTPHNARIDAAQSPVVDFDDELWDEDDDDDNAAHGGVQHARSSRNGGEEGVGAGKGGVGGSGSGNGSGGNGGDDGVDSIPLLSETHDSFSSSEGEDDTAGGSPYNATHMPVKGESSDAVLQLELVVAQREQEIAQLRLQVRRLELKARSAHGTIANLEEQVQQERALASEAKRRAQRAEERLVKVSAKEQAETRVLEDMVARVEQQLSHAEARATAATSEVTLLRQRVERMNHVARLLGLDEEGGAPGSDTTQSLEQALVDRVAFFQRQQGQVRATARLARKQLQDAADEAMAGVRKLVEGSQALNAISSLLQAMERVQDEPDQ